MPEAPENNPFLRPTLKKRATDWLRWFGQLPRQAYEGFRNWSPILQRLVVGLGILASIGGIYFGTVWYLRRANEMAVMREWTRVEHEIKQNSETKKVVEGLDRILEILPNDVRANKFKATLISGEADPSDDHAVFLVINKHMREQAPDALLREVQKRLQYKPTDFYAHYLAARCHLAKNQLEPARKHLEAMSRPDINKDSLNFVAVDFALNVLPQFNMDVTKLRDFTAANIQRQIQGEHVAYLEPGAIVMHLRLYSETFSLPTLPSDTFALWPLSQKLAQASIDGAVNINDLNSLKALGNIAPRFADLLVRLHGTRQINDEQRAEMSRDLEARTQRLWELVINKEPKNADAYVGLLASQLRAGQQSAALQTLVKGLKTCGDQPRLIGIYNEFAIQNDRGMDSYQLVRAAAERNPNYPRYWIMAAQAAFSGRRRDLALECLDKAHLALPEELEIVCMQAVYVVDTGRPELVLNYLNPIGDERLTRMPGIAPVFTRALAEINDEERLDAYLAAVQELSKSQNQPAYATQAARGVLEATPPTVGSAKRAAEYLLPITERWSVTYPLCAHLYAQAVCRICELNPEGFDPVLARNAVIACEKALSVDRNQPQTAANLVLYRLLGEQDPPKAFSDAEPLMEMASRLLPEQAEVLAMVYNANQKPNEAVRAVQIHTQARPTAGCWVQLAWAYWQQGRRDDALNALDEAAKMQKSDREHREYLRVRELTAKASR